MSLSGEQEEQVAGHLVDGLVLSSSLQLVEFALVHYLTRTSSAGYIAQPVDLLTELLVRGPVQPLTGCAAVADEMASVACPLQSLSDDTAVGDLPHDVQ